MTIGSLFSGIGGLELGLEWAGLGPTVWQVEIDPFCRQVLAWHWPLAERFADIRTVGAHNLPRVDVITGGFPCQDISNAGKREGIQGARSGLWQEFARVLGELRPRVAIVENVAALAARGLDRVLGDLAEIGYDAEWFCLRASDVGAPHRRERMFIVAHPGHNGRGGLASCDRAQGPLDVQGRHDAPRRGVDVAHPVGDSPRLFPERLQRKGRRIRASERGDAVLVDPRAPGGRDVEPVLGRVPHGVPARVDTWPAGKGQPQLPWEPPRAIAPDRGTTRRARLRSLGNAVVPECARVVGEYAKRYL